MLPNISLNPSKSQTMYPTLASFGPDTNPLQLYNYTFQTLQFQNHVTINSIYNPIRPKNYPAAEVIATNRRSDLKAANMRLSSKRNNVESSKGKYMIIGFMPQK